MKIFETPVLNIKEFSRGNIITLSGEEPTNKSAVAAAKERLQQVNSEATIFSFVADNV